jgi:hypothetical protein
MNTSPRSGVYEQQPYDFEKGESSVTTSATGIVPIQLTP